jgi:hypothetical protein
MLYNVSLIGEFMAKAYTKEDLIGAFLMRFIKAGLDITNLEIMANEFFDKVGRDKFRSYASVDAEVMREYREFV